MNRQVVKKEVPRALTDIKTQGDKVTPCINYTTGLRAGEGGFADSNLADCVPLFEGKVPKDVIKDGITDCMWCIGRCMEPTIRHGGILGFDFYDRELVENEIYCFELEGWKPVIQVKRLFKVLPGVGLLLTTDNSTWPDYFVREGKFKVIGKVKWIYNEGVTIWK